MTKHEEFWIIIDINDGQSFTGTFFTRAEAIHDFCESRNDKYKYCISADELKAFYRREWRKAKAQGCRAVKAMLSFKLPKQ